MDGRPITVDIELRFQISPASGGDGYYKCGTNWKFLLSRDSRDALYISQSASVKHSQGAYTFFLPGFVLALRQIVPQPVSRTNSRSSLF